MTDYEQESLARLSEVSTLLAKVLAKLEELDKIHALKRELETAVKRLDSIAYSCREIHIELPGQGNWNFQCRSPGSQY
jgi:hypothetical protein